MHYYTWVIIPEDAPREETVEAVLEPYRDGGRAEHPAGWDWYALGGRWDHVKDATLPALPQSDYSPAFVYAADMGAIYKYDYLSDDLKDNYWQKHDQDWLVELGEFMSRIKRGRVVVVDIHS